MEWHNINIHPCVRLTISLKYIIFRKRSFQFNMCGVSLAGREKRLLEFFLGLQKLGPSISMCKIQVVTGNEVVVDCRAKDVRVGASLGHSHEVIVHRRHNGFRVFCRTQRGTLHGSCAGRGRGRLLPCI